MTQKTQYEILPLKFLNEIQTNCSRDLALLFLFHFWSYTLSPLASPLSSALALKESQNRQASLIQGNAKCGAGDVTVDHVGGDHPSGEQIKASPSSLPPSKRTTSKINPAGAAVFESVFTLPLRQSSPMEQSAPMAPDHPLDFTTLRGRGMARARGSGECTHYRTKFNSTCNSKRRVQTMLFWKLRLGTAFPITDDMLRDQIWRNLDSCDYGLK